MYRAHNCRFLFQMFNWVHFSFFRILNKFVLLHPWFLPVFSKHPYFAETIYRSNHWRCFVKKVFLNCRNTGKHLCLSLFLIKLYAFRSATLLSRDSSTGVFLWMLQNFQEHLFWKTSANFIQTNYCKLIYNNMRDIPFKLSTADLFM